MKERRQPYKFFAMSGAALCLTIKAMTLAATPDVEAETEMVTETTTEPYSVEEITIQIIEPEEATEVTKETEVPETAEISRFTDEDIYMLAKIAMAEAEGEDVEGKALIMCVVLNRLNTEGYPDSIEEVIMEKYGNTYQFSVTKKGGRWWTTEPDEECYEAAELVTSGWDESNGALYFDGSQTAYKWHRKNLKFLFKHGDIEFYTRKDA